MRERFRVPLSKEDTIEFLLDAVCAEVEFREREFVKNEDQMEQIALIAEWLRGESSKFGLVLCGMCGNGKTTFVKAIQQMVNILDITVSEYDRREKYGMRIYNARQLASICRADYKEFQKICMLRMLAIDDLGTEPFEVKDYSNTLNPLSDLLLERYDKRLFTIVTTNLTPDQLREKYGERLADRFNEMMEKVIFKNQSFRSL